MRGYCCECNLESAQAVEENIKAQNLRNLANSEEEGE